MQLEVLVQGSGRPYVEGDAVDQRVPLVFTVASVLSRDECARLIAKIDALGPTTAPISTRRGPVMRPDVRNNQRVMFDDVAFARDLFARIESAVPPHVAGGRAAGVNERFRCYRYEPGQQFAPHLDGAFVRDAHERSELTFMVYLNESFDGGKTTFNEVAVAPRTGMALLFQHHQLHEGSTVTRGVKYVLRTDVMYRMA